VDPGSKSLAGVGGGPIRLEYVLLERVEDVVPRVDNIRFLFGGVNCEDQKAPPDVELETGAGQAGLFEGDRSSARDGKGGSSGNERSST